MNLKTQPKQALDQAPRKTRSVILSDDFHVACEDLAKKYNIKTEYCGDLTNLIIYKTLDIINDGDFQTEIYRIVGENQNIIRSLVNDIDSKIVNNINNIYIQSLSTLKKEMQEKGEDFDIDEYIESENIFDKMSENIYQRIYEISKKYNLSDNQTNTIKTYTIKSIRNPYLFIHPIDIVKKINTSKLISEHLAEEIQVRIFDYIDKQRNDSVSTNDATKNLSVNSLLPEIKTDKLPVTETEQYKSEKITDLPVPNYNYTPRPKVVLSDEPVQSPITVPRFKAVPLSDTELSQNFIPNIPPKPNSTGIMDTKLNSITKSIDESKPNNPPIPKYTTDPYREPLS